jgi:hypothetical protein
MKRLFLIAGVSALALASLGQVARAETIVHPTSSCSTISAFAVVLTNEFVEKKGTTKDRETVGLLLAATSATDVETLHVLFNIVDVVVYDFALAKSIWYANSADGRVVLAQHLHSQCLISKGVWNSYGVKKGAPASTLPPAKRIKT